jgi:hypothetical protein
MCQFDWNTILCISLCIIFPCTLRPLRRYRKLNSFYKQISNVIVQIDALKDLFSQFVSSEIFLQYKSQCMEKVNVKYVIKRLRHEIFHIVRGINPRSISALQLRCRAWYGSLGLIPSRRNVLYTIQLNKYFIITFILYLSDA